MIETVQAWGDALISLHQHIGRHFRRAEPRRRVLTYLQALLSPCERKNGWHLAETIGDPTPDGVQRLLNAACWDADAVRDDLRTYVTEHLGDPNAVLVIDETSFRKRGDKSVGVQKQYCGTTSELENCQVAVFLSYATAHGAAFIDRALYLPKTWTRDRRRCQEAGVPDEVPFATKSELALMMLERTVRADVQVGWVAADSLYGCDRQLRTWLEQRHHRYVLAIRSSDLVARDRFWRLPAKDVGEGFAARKWHRLSAGAGTKGPRWFDWAWCALPSSTRGQDRWDWRHWLLVRRPIHDPTDLTYYLVFAPEATTLQEVALISGMRWHIEVGFESAKGDCGLEDYEVRTWTAWYRHVTLVLLAHAFLGVMRAKSLQKKRDRQRRMRAFLLHLRRSVDLSGTCSGHGHPARRPSLHGHAGDAGINGGLSRLMPVAVA